MTQHVTKDDLVLLRERKLAPERIIEVVRHLESCSECAAMASDTVDAEAAAESWSATLHPAVEDRRWRRKSAVLGAAAALLIVIGIAALVVRAPTQLPHRTAVRPVSASVWPATPPADALPAAWQALVDAAVANGRIAPPAILATLHMPGDVPRGGGARKPSAVFPDGVMVESSRPTFLWNGSTGTVYIVSVFDGDREVMRSAPLHDNIWKLQRDLPRGRTYRWQVEARRDAETWIIPMTPQPAPTFAILDDAAHRELESARRRYPGDHLLLGVLAAHCGLQREAVEELMRHQSSHRDPRSAALLDSVRAWSDGGWP